MPQSTSKELFKLHENSGCHTDYKGAFTPALQGGTKTGLLATDSNTCHFTATLALPNADSSFKLPPLYN